MRRRLGAAVVAAVVGFVAAAIALTILDLYLGGHGGRPLGERRLVDVDRAGIHLSLADGLALGVGALAALAAAIASGPPRRE